MTPLTWDEAETMDRDKLRSSRVSHHFFIEMYCATAAVVVQFFLTPPDVAQTCWTIWTYLPTSVTRFGDLLNFGQLFKASGNNYFAQLAYILGNFCKGVKTFNFTSEIIFGQPI